MKFRDRITGQIYSLFDIQQKFPNVSFPQVWSNETYDFANVDPVTQTLQPAETNIRNRVDFAGVQLVAGVWTETWIEVPKYDDTTEQAEWEATCLETEWDAVRDKRNTLLTATDYTQFSDTPITIESKAAFATYRQALRDITTQTDPTNIVWPVRPTYQKE